MQEKDQLIPMRWGPPGEPVARVPVRNSEHQALTATHNDVPEMWASNSVVIGCKWSVDWSHFPSIKVLDLPNSNAPGTNSSPRGFALGGFPPQQRHLGLEPQHDHSASKAQQAQHRSFDIGVVVCSAQRTRSASPGPGPGGSFAGRGVQGLGRSQRLRVEAAGTPARPDPFAQLDRIPTCWGRPTPQGARAWRLEKGSSAGSQPLRRLAPQPAQQAAGAGVQGFAVLGSCAGIPVPLPHVQHAL